MSRLRELDLVRKKSNLQSPSIFSFAGSLWRLYLMRLLAQLDVTPKFQYDVPGFQEGKPKPEELHTERTNIISAQFPQFQLKKHERANLSAFRALYFTSKCWNADISTSPSVLGWGGLLHENSSGSLKNQFFKLTLGF